MPIVAFTDRFCMNVKAATRTDYFDSKMQALCFALRRADTKLSTFTIRLPMGSARGLSLGAIPPCL
jgi:hypothetical protein